MEKIVEVTRDLQMNTIARLSNSAKEIGQLYMKSSIYNWGTCGFPDVIGHQPLTNILMAKEEGRYNAMLEVSHISTAQEVSPVLIFHLP